jgi:folylpolyglutamate synthase/dihydropteroate synthase
LPDDGSNVRSLALDGLANDAVTLGLQDPAQAAALLTSLGRNETKVSADDPTALVAGSWLMRDPAAATQWIGNLPAGNTKDSAILAVVGVTADSDPATAFTWLRTMTNPGTRGTTTTQLITQWAKTNPDAAQAAVLQAYPNNNNGRQATLLGIIQQARASNTQTNSP